MGVLGNSQHERFCQDLHKRLWAGEKRREALCAAYQTVGYATTEPYANARRLANKSDVKARLQELATRSAQLAEIDAGWCLLKLKAVADSNLDDYLGPADAAGRRGFAIGQVSRERLGQLKSLAQEEHYEPGDEGAEPTLIRKVRVELFDRIQAVGRIAKIAGFMAPTKVAATDSKGEDVPPATDEERIRALAAIFARVRAENAAEDAAAAGAMPEAPSPPAD